MHACMLGGNLEQCMKMKHMMNTSYPKKVHKSWIKGEKFKMMMIDTDLAL